MGRRMHRFDGKIRNARRKCRIALGAFVFLLPSSPGSSLNPSEFRNIILAPKNIINASAYGEYETFATDEELEGRINFWRNIYGTYHSWEAVIHDADMPQVIFEVADHHDLIRAKYNDWNLMTSIYRRSGPVKKKYQAILRGISLKREAIIAGQADLSLTEKSILDKYTKFMSLE